MIKLPFELGCSLMKNNYNIFGYLCNQGAVIGEEEFIVYSDDKDYYLMHKSEIESQGLFVRIKPKSIFPEFKEFKKIPRLTREVIITEKIDGTNGLIYIDEDNNIFAGSRNRWLWSSIQDEIHNDNHGFAQWVKVNKEELLKLGKGFHYGEWMGKGIQRGYGLEEKRFYLFNAGRWCMWNVEPKLISKNEKTGEEKYQEKAPKCCYIVPILDKGIFDITCIYSALDKLIVNGSFAVPGFMNPEGIVIYHTAGNLYFKKTIKNDEKGKNE